MITLHRNQVLRGHTGPVYSVCRGTGEDRFFSAGSDGFVVEWDLTTGVSGRVIKVGEPVYSVLYEPQRDLLIAGAASGRIHVIDLAQSREVRCIELHKQGVFDIRLSPDTQTLITAGGDGKIFIWDYPDINLRHAVSPDGHKCRQVVFRDDSRFFVATSSGKVYELTMDPVRITADWDAHDGGVYSLLWDALREVLLTGGKDAHIRAWSHQKQLLALPAHNYAIYAIEPGPAGKWVASGSRDKTIKLWDPRSMDVICRAETRNGGHSRSVNDLIWMGDRIISCSDDGTIICWSPREGDPVSGM